MLSFTSGIAGGNLLIMKVNDASVIANLNDGWRWKSRRVFRTFRNRNKCCFRRAMNQMIGSAATSMATMFRREVNISPPVSKRL